MNLRKLTQEVCNKDITTKQLNNDINEGFEEFRSETKIQRNTTKLRKISEEDNKDYEFRIKLLQNP